MHLISALIVAASAGACLAGGTASAQDLDKPYEIADDGTVDWYTFSGFRRYHADCHVCHGPDGLGSSFGPALAESLKVLSYDDFLEIVVNGRERVSSSEFRKMPAFGSNPNVMCFITDLYAYLKARSDGALGRGRPEKRVEKSQEAKDRDAACLPSE
jgi:methanol metabolism-related c-type cytochrome